MAGLGFVGTSSLVSTIGAVNHIGAGSVPSVTTGARRPTLSSAVWRKLASHLLSVDDRAKSLLLRRREEWTDAVDESLTRIGEPGALVESHRAQLSPGVL